MISRLLVATSNPGKLREFALALGREGIEVHGLEDLAQVSKIEEMGSTFEENARLKAEGYSRQTDLTVVADDSGLVVDALGGAPGVASARYGGPEIDDAGRNRLLLEALRGVSPERRTARFVCVLVLARSGLTLTVFRGVVEGTILEEARGHQGFGYDPVFFHAPSGRSFGELSLLQKQHVSHRGLALAALISALEHDDAGLVR